MSDRLAILDLFCYAKLIESSLMCFILVYRIKEHLSADAAWMFEC